MTPIDDGAVIETALVLASDAAKSVAALGSYLPGVARPLLCDVEARALDEAERMAARGVRCLAERKSRR